MQTTRIKGLTIAALGVLFIVPDALLVKITSVEPVVFLFWRGLLLALSFLVISWARYRARLIPEIRKCGRKGLFCAGAFAISTLGFVVGMKNTAAGNVLVILNTAPVIAALIAWAIWKETLPLRTWLVILVCVAGATLMAVGEFGKGDPLGLLMAAVAATALASNLNVARSKPDSDMSVMLMFGALVLALAAALMGGAQWPSARDFFFIALLCLVFLPTACILIQIGPRYIPAAEVSLMLLLETVLGSFLVWLFLGEVPPKLSLVGGVIVFSALATHGWLEVRRYQRAKRFPLDRADQVS
ncbi:Permease of the drug/metabolite transporter (DMT) superfamily [Marinobacter gudaonensis]|uniref:Permease of the drug/metabolite transporter (DMT) superfamily n=1 Tax=Marinobacter gudaonensis TaxID=375760 RepID=A0A1I6GB69_9GAMM|nr:DMT family transporter [Marinobacter gudaonensis]SFR39371.1 Permease of the drug/metabolite transporter (DMT) superfamily [Marinobacter gudaonensis]